jgi:hypothetical protein
MTRKNEAPSYHRAEKILTYWHVQHHTAYDDVYEVHIEWCVCVCVCACRSNEGFPLIW